MSGQLGKFAAGNEQLFVSPATRLLAAEKNTTVVPSALIPGSVLAPLAWAPPEAVNLYEAPASGNYWAASSVSGLLIHAVFGSLGGSGSLRTNRSGWAA
jgi:hypothetical protein